MPLIKLPRRHAELPDGVTTWHVKVPADKQYELVFDTRDAARRYRKSLAESKRHFETTLVRHAFSDGYMVDEVVS